MCRAGERGPSECGVSGCGWHTSLSGRSRGRGIGNGFKWKSLVHTGRVRIVFKSFRLQSEIAATVSIRLKDVTQIDGRYPTGDA